MNVFRDAVERGEQGMLRLMDDKTRRAAYLAKYAGQILTGSVPDDIIKEYLIPYMRGPGNPTYLRASCDDGGVPGFWIGVNKEGEVRIVREYDDRHVTDTSIYGILYDKSMYDPQTMDQAMGTAGFLFRRGDNKQEIERRFWVLAFNNCFQCGWHAAMCLFFEME